jgi:hypothetical protein
VRPLPPASRFGMPVRPCKELSGVLGVSAKGRRKSRNNSSDAWGDVISDGLETPVVADFETHRRVYPVQTVRSVLDNGRRILSRVRVLESVSRPVRRSYWLAKKLSDRDGIRERRRQHDIRGQAKESRYRQRGSLRPLFG